MVATVQLVVSGLHPWPQLSTSAAACWVSQASHCPLALHTPGSAVGNADPMCLRAGWA